MNDISWLLYCCLLCSSLLKVIIRTLNLLIIFKRFPWIFILWCLDQTNSQTWTPLTVLTAHQGKHSYCISKTFVILLLLAIVLSCTYIYCIQRPRMNYGLYGSLDTAFTYFNTVFLPEGIGCHSLKSTEIHFHQSVFIF